MKRHLFLFLATLGGLVAIFTLVHLFSFAPVAARPAGAIVEEAPAVDTIAERRPSSSVASSDRRAYRPEINQRPKFIHSMSFDPYPVSSVNILVNYAYDWVAGSTDPGATLAITVTNNAGVLKENAVVAADGAGDFSVGCNDWTSGLCPDIQPGDRVMASAGGTLGEISPVGSISGTLDAAENTVSGELNADWFDGPLEVRCEIWEAPEALPIVKFVNTNGGPFTCDFDDVGWDLERGQTVAVWYIEPDDDWVGNVFAVLEPYPRIDKVYESSRLPKAAVTYTLSFSNVGEVPASGLVISDQLPSSVTWKSGGNYDPGSQTITWDWPDLAVGASGSVQFTGELSCSGVAINDRYRVASSDQGVSGPWGAPLSFTILEPTIQADFNQSATRVRPGDTVVFTDSTTSNGPPLATLNWDFDDGTTDSGPTVSHTFSVSGEYDVELTATDQCGYSDIIVRSVVVDYVSFIPLVIND